MKERWIVPCAFGASATSASTRRKVDSAEDQPLTDARNPSSTTRRCLCFTPIGSPRASAVP